MMVKALTIGACLFMAWSTGYARSTEFEADTLIKVSGHVISKLDSSFIKASITYQKLPYYDDMGLTSSKVESGYEILMVKDVRYLIQVKAEGFDPLEQEILVLDKQKSGSFQKNFVLNPDIDHQVIQLNNLIFASGKAIMSKASYKELDELVGWLKARPDKVIQLEGHTDMNNSRNAAANMELSESRVQAVKNYLVSNGIKKNRVKTKAFGGTQPLTAERTDGAKAMNRRVEVRIIN